jgi:tight adherence protein B
MITLATVTFGLVLLLILAIYALFVVVPERRAHSQLTKRLTPETAKRKRSLLISRTEPGGEVGEESPIGRLIRPLVEPVRRLLERAGLRMSVPVFLLLVIWAGALSSLLAWLATGRPELAVFFGPACAFVPYAWIKHLGERRMWKFEEQFPEAVDLVARALRAGHALPTALGMVASEVPNPVGGEFKRLYDQQNFGMSLPDALRAFAQRVPVLDARFFVTAVLTQRESGGNLSGVLDNLGAVIRERFKIKRQVRVISAHGRMTAMILSALPPLLAMAITVIAPSTMMILIQDPLGIKMIVAAVTLQLVGTVIMRKIVNVEI